MDDFGALNYGLDYGGSQFLGDQAPGATGVAYQNPFGVLSTVSAGVLDLARSAAALQAAYWGASDARATAQLNRDTSRIVTTTNADIERLNAQARLTAAQKQLSGSNADGLTMLAANLNAQIARMTSGNNWQLWLAAIGVGFAFLQWKRGR